MTATEWAAAPKAVDPNHAGSIYEQLGLSDKLCPMCNSHLTQDGICLNACHLGLDGVAKFGDFIKSALAIVNTRGDNNGAAE